MRGSPSLNGLIIDSALSVVTPRVYTEVLPHSVHLHLAVQWTHINDSIFTPELEGLGMEPVCILCLCDKSVSLAGIEIRVLGWTLLDRSIEMSQKWYAYFGYNKDVICARSSSGFLSLLARRQGGCA